MKSTTEEELPPFAEQMSQQLGGLKGIIESGIPVTVFVIANLVLGWAMPSPPAPDRFTLKIAIIAAVVVAVGIALLRLARKESMRFAINGLFGIALGAWLAWDTGEERAFYLPGIFITLGYVVLLFGSIVIGHPLVGWLWTIIANGGKGDWRAEVRQRRLFGWLTGLWATVFLLKASIQSALYYADYATALGVARIALGYPVFALLIAVSFWAIRRVRREEPALS
ncbi:DUF3159 domain-containing protein [Allorhizocola rhizosphaerae]|uniref:DUF3159 domain-containing protein n=1 Tax=Allorhizocola rhizosphaerae TaxID=1872709 RepID=UPI000E3D5E79|nr:DUF3159 domain-containing protein [Allorhizocola rhizosphaerae]